MYKVFIEIVVTLVNPAGRSKFRNENVGKMSNVAENCFKSQINCKFAGCDPGNPA
jgi:hypothetical protein